MKGVIVNCRISEGAIASLHGAYGRIFRLVIPERDNLTITPHGQNLYVWRGEKDEGATVAEVEVPDSLVAQAEEILLRRDNLRRRLTESPAFTEYFGNQ